jgi:hypothetical protein
MGAWGTGIFANDTAADVQAEWRAAILDGEDPAKTSARMVRQYTREEGSGLWATDFFSGLAAAQLETGRLQPAVRDRALELIAAGGDVELWRETDPAAARARRRALTRLAARLRGPQPAPKRLRRPPAAPDPGVEIGDVLRIDAPDGARSALFCVVAMETDRRGRYPVLLALHWRGGEVPPPDRLATLEFLSDIDTSSFDGDELPDYVDGVAPMVVTALMDRRGDEFGPHIGAVVARGVRRASPGPSGTVTTFAGIAAIVGSPDFDLRFQATRRRLEKYGDDPEPWIRAREEYLAQTAPMIEFLLEQAGFDRRDFGPGAH